MKKWRSRVTTDGLDRAPHRAFMRAMGLDDEALARPMIGVVSMKGEQTPCNMTHDFQVDAAKAGIAEAGGTPREFTTISVSDGISMNHEGMKFSLLSRELIADSIEAVVHGLAYDALIGFGGCDKTLPGVMMGMIRCNVPSIFIYGGSALPGRFEGKTLTVLDSYEAVGGFMTGEIDAATRWTIAARNRDAKVAGKRRGHCRRYRRIDQCGAAFAGTCQRGRHILHIRRRRRGLCANTSDRKLASGREVYREGCLRYRRRRRGRPRADRKRPHRRQLPDDYRQDDCRRIRQRQCARRRDHHLCRRGDQSRRRCRGLEGQPLP